MFGECDSQITNIFSSKEDYQYGKSKSKGKKASKEGCCIKEENNKEALVSVSKICSL